MAIDISELKNWIEAQITPKWLRRHRKNEIIQFIIQHVAEMQETKDSPQSSDEPQLENKWIPIQSSDEPQLENKWIPIRKKFPLLYKNVLCLCKNGKMVIAKYGHDEALWFNLESGVAFRTGFVTHWLPIPEPPEENNEPHTLEYVPLDKETRWIVTNDEAY